jgi:hypothetical protein
MRRDDPQKTGRKVNIAYFPGKQFRPRAAFLPLCPRDNEMTTPALYPLRPPGEKSASGRLRRPDYTKELTLARKLYLSVYMITQPKQLFLGAAVILY